MTAPLDRLGHRSREPHPLGHLRRGGARWGYLTTTVSRYGSAFSTIVIYPPGTTDQERRWLRVCRAWPVLGLMLAGAAAAALTLDVASAAAFLGASGIYVAGGILVATRSAHARRASVHLTVRTSIVVPGVDHVDGLDHLSAIAQALRRADRQLDDGYFTPLEHELVWAAAYRSVGAARRASGA